MASGLHHFHKRKRIHKKLEKYPHPDKFKRFLDKFIYVVGVAAPIFTLPQIYSIWIGKNAAGVSLVTWSAYAFSGVIWFVYGIVHKEKPLIVTYFLWIILNSMVIAGVLIYG